MSLERFSRPEITTTTRPSSLSKRTQGQLNTLQSQTMLRIAKVQAEGIVAAEKVREVTHLGHRAMTEQALLRMHLQTLAHGDAILADELDIFPAVVRAANVQLIESLFATYEREANGI